MPDADKVEGPVIKIMMEKVRKVLCDKKWKSSKTIRNSSGGIQSTGRGWHNMVY